MAYRLDLVALAEIEHTVKARAHTQASGICLRDSEFAEKPAVHLVQPAGLAVVGIVSLPEEPVHSVTYARGEVKILQKGKIREPNLEIVLHSVLELVREAFLAEFRGFEGYLVLERCAVAQGELLVELFLADAVLLLERIEPGHRESEVGKREHIGAVSGVLAVQCIDGQAELAVPVLRV